MTASEMIERLTQLLDTRGDLELYVDIDKPTPYRQVVNVKVVMPPDQVENDDPRIVFVLKS